jgi:hypothetical protein
MADFFVPSFVLARCAFFSRGGKRRFPPLRWSLLAGNEALARSYSQTAAASETSDVNILNTALGAEQETQTKPRARNA